MSEKMLAEIREQHASDVERCARGGFALTYAAKDIGYLLAHVDALVAALQKAADDLHDEGLVDEAKSARAALAQVQP